MPSPLLFCQLGARLDRVAQRQILDILHDSLADRPNKANCNENEVRPNKANCNENEVRYKLIIDPSEDDSLVRLLFTFRVLDRKKTHVFMCSDFSGDTHLQKVSIYLSNTNHYYHLHSKPTLPPTH